MRSLRLSQDVQLQSANNSNPLLSRGATGSGVAILQDLLADLGCKFIKTFSHGRADGIFGPETESAVKQFQTRAGLRADGIVGPRTLAALDGAIIEDDRLERRRRPHRGNAGYW
jgi:peptidoglycan hydrolase-like protein with peptidoglycan-binding domain